MSREKGGQCHVCISIDGVLWRALAAESSQSPGMTSYFSQVVDWFHIDEAWVTSSPYSKSRSEK